MTGSNISNERTNSPPTPTGLEPAQEWLMYDVGGTRTLRAAWAPYLADDNDLAAIIFLAPTSCFDETLAENPRVNRLEDSFLLWKAVCGNKLLGRVMLVLFLNKCDLLERKLRAGVRFGGFVKSYERGGKGEREGERRNEVGCVKKCEFGRLFVLKPIYG